ncbi:ABC-F family ATP-binding cassette domain-containing protein [Candidatus Margulisiibacteriota bacterium]
MLQINNLSLSFGEEQILDDISFNIHQGERIGLVGRNGSGKTSIFRLITDEIHPDEGRIAIPKNYTIGYLKQHLSFTKPTVLEEACLGLKEDEKDQTWKADKILFGLGFTKDELDKSPMEFSGGFQVRLNLAKVLLAEPHLLLLDEPTNYLDIVSIRWFTKFLQTWDNELILVTHDRDFMNKVTTHTMAIHRRKLKKIEGGTAKLFEQIAVDEDVYERTRKKDQKKRDDAMKFINRFRAQAARASLVQSRIKALEKMGEKKELAAVTELGFRFNAAEFQPKFPMTVKELSFGYSPDKILIEGLSIDIKQNDRICVIGKNGKGKSTLLRLLVRELEPKKGEITTHPTCKLGYFGQTNIESLNPKNTIEQELHQIRSDMSYPDIRRTCGAMMFSGDLALKKISILSGGEKSRVSLGKILLSPANILLLDEPTNHLDIESCDSMIAALDEFTGAVVIVTHSEMFLHHLANRLIVFNEGRVSVFEGTYQNFLDKVGWEEEAKKPKKIKTSKKDKVGQKASALEYKKKHKALHKKIADIESEIDDEEAALEDNDKKIIETVKKGNSSDIRSLQIKGHNHQQTIDAKYKELETMIAELDVLDKAKPVDEGVS